MADMAWEDEGWPELIEELQAETFEAARMAVKEAAMHLENAIKRKLLGQRTGTRYASTVRDPVTGRKQRTEWTASRPGEPPAVLFGNLRKYTAHSEPELVGNVVQSAVGPDLEIVPYARRLEYGGYHITPNGKAVYIAPRPYLRPTFEEQRSTLEEMLRRGAGAR